MTRPYDLDERTLAFARSVVGFINTLPRTVANTEIVRQLVRSSTSVGANYIEASEFLGKKDFGLRIKICRKEAKETVYWLKLVEIRNDEIKKERAALIDEATQLTKIFGAIVSKYTDDSRVKL